VLSCNGSVRHPVCGFHSWRPLVNTEMSYASGVTKVP
jgi:hypothetical protein